MIEFFKRIISKIKKGNEVCLEHYCDGYEDYDVDLYLEKKDTIIKIIKKLRRKKEFPCIGSTIIAGQNEFHIKRINHHTDIICYWVDEYREREVDFEI